MMKGPEDEIKFTKRYSDEMSVYVTGNKGERYILLPDTPLPEGFEGPTGFLGKGEFGSVSVALDENLNTFAVKELNLEKGSSNFARVLTDIEKEAEFLKRLGRKAEIIFEESDDPNKLKVLIVQTFIKGKSLERYFKWLTEQSQKPENQNDIAKMVLLQKAVRSFIAAFNATKQCHDANIVQGDLHPGNIIFDDSTGIAQVIDFGLSYVIPENQTCVYVTGDTEVTNYHRAPETVTAQQRRPGFPPERVYDKSSDVYSLAIDCAIWSDFADYVPACAGKELAELMALFKQLSQDKNLGGNDQREDRLTLDQGIIGLQEIQQVISQRIAQRRIIESSVELMKRAEKLQTLSAFQNQARKHGLPVDLQENIKRRAQEIQDRIAMRDRGTLPESSKYPSKRARPISPTGQELKNKENKPDDFQFKKSKPGKINRR